MKKEKMSKSDPAVSSQCGCSPVLLQESRQHLWKQQMQIASHLALSLGGTCSFPCWLPCSSRICKAHPSHTTEWTESRRQLCLCKWHRPSYHTQEKKRDAERGTEWTPGLDSFCCPEDVLSTPTSCLSAAGGCSSLSCWGSSSFLRVWSMGRPSNFTQRQGKFFWSILAWPNHWAMFASWLSLSPGGDMIR